MSRDLDAVLASIDGALADEEFPDAMRWSPEPETVDDARAPFDGETVWVGPEERASTYDEALDYDPALPIGPRNFPLVSTRRGGIRFPRPSIEHREGCSIVHRYGDGRPDSCQCGALDRAALAMPRGRTPDLVIVDDPIGRIDRVEETADGLVVSGVLNADGARLAERLGIGRVEWRPLTMPEAVGLALQAEQSREEYEEALDRLRVVFAPVAEHLAAMVETFGRIASEAGLRFSELIDAIGKAARSDAPIPPPPRLRVEDPRAYALQLRQSRGTGPDRQLQRQHRPRRHR